MSNEIGRNIEFLAIPDSLNCFDLIRLLNITGRFSALDCRRLSDLFLIRANYLTRQASENSI
jgi:hypothetical protein